MVVDMHPVLTIASLFQIFGKLVRQEGFLVPTRILLYHEP